MRKLAVIIIFRLKAMIGRIWLLLFLLLALSFCFYVANGIVNAPVAKTLNIAVVDLDESHLSMELSAQLRSLEGVQLSVLGEEEAQMSLARGNVEGILTIGAGYADALENALDLPLFYDSSAAVATRTAAREMIAGQVITQRSVIRAKTELEDAGVQVSSEELAALLLQFNEQANPLYRFSVDTTISPVSHNIGDMFAGYLGFVALAMILTMMTLSQWFALPDSKQVVRRMQVLPTGKKLSFGADVLSLLVVGGVMVLLAYLFASSLSFVEVIYLLAYAYGIMGVCLLLSRWQEAGSIDVLAPLIALFTSILGGSFMNLSSLSPMLRILSLVTPQGQMLYGIGYGLIWPLFLLLAVGTILLGIAWKKEG